jgi:hypothetical protein
MTQYLVLLPASEPRYAAGTDQEKQELHQAHNEFAALLAERGHKMVGGAQLTPSTLSRVARGDGVDQVSLTDGPYAESAEQVGGYYLVESDDVDDLGQVCGRLLATPFHQAIEIRPTVEM